MSLIELKNVYLWYGNFFAFPVNDLFSRSITSFSFL